tara:strand:+ start:64 stop:609 length:546 start_codon:yes stop_codon:yes gene_type:complete
MEDEKVDELKVDELKIDELKVDTNLSMKKSRSYDMRRCIICLISADDKNNDEDIILNRVCENCVYYVHDSCFSCWYQDNNKCIICREVYESEEDYNEVENDSEHRYLLSPRTRDIIRLMEVPSVIFLGNRGPPTRVNGGVIGYISRSAECFVNTVYFCSLFTFFYLIITGWILIDDTAGSI